MNTKAVGECTEAQVLARLTSLGYPVLIPFGNNQRYDLVAEKNGVFVRGQCKTANYVNGCLSFSVASVNGFTGVRTPYSDQVDVFWVYSGVSREVYEVPSAIVGINECRLRIEPAKGGRQDNIRWARDFVLDK